MFIRSKRLFLRPFWPEDGLALANLSKTEDAPGPVATVLGSVEPEDRRSARFLITLPGQGIVGAVSLAHMGDAGELRLWIAPAWRNRGFAAEAVEALVDVARMLGHGRLDAKVDLQNWCAAKLFDIAGFAPSRPAGSNRRPTVNGVPGAWFHRDLSRPATGEDNASRNGTDTLAA